jgi:carbonic anhydrase
MKSMAETPSAQEAIAQAENTLRAKENETTAAVAVQKVSLQSWCETRSKQARQVELLGAFFSVSTAKHHLLDTPANFEAAYDALRNQPA